MKFISFAWTTETLLNGTKTCTRRKWKDNWAKRFHNGDLVAAYDKLPRAHGHKVATIQLTSDPIKQNTADMPWSDYVCEGLYWMGCNRKLIQGMTPKDFWIRWRKLAEDVWVIRFKLMSEVQIKIQQLQDKGWTLINIARKLGQSSVIVESWKVGTWSPANLQPVLASLDRLLKRKRIPKKRRYAAGNRKISLNNI